MKITHLQQKDDDDCGPTCVAMITGLRISCIKSDIKIYKRGTYVVQLAAYLRHVGFTVVYNYFNPLFLRLCDEGKCDSEELMNRLSKLELKDSDQKNCYNYMIHYLKHRKETIHISMVTTEGMKSVLDMGGVLLCLMTSNYLYTDEHSEFNCHYNIVVGYDDEGNFQIYDPLCKDDLFIPMEKYLCGIYATTGNEMLDSGSVLAVYDLRRK